MTVSILNVPDVEFPVRFRQRISHLDRVYEFLLDENNFQGRATLTVGREGDVLVESRPLFLLSPVGDTLATAELVAFAVSNDRARSPSKLPTPNETTIRSGVVDVYVRGKDQ